MWGIFQNLEKKLLTISIFDYLRYYARVEHEVLNILHNGVIIVKVSKIYGLYFLEGSNVTVVYSLSTSEDFQTKKKLWNLRSRHGGFLEVVSYHFNEFRRR